MRSKKSWRGLNLFSLEKRVLRGIFLMSNTYLIGAYREDGDSLLSDMHTENKKVTNCIKGNSSHM